MLLHQLFWGEGIRVDGEVEDSSCGEGVWVDGEWEDEKKKGHLVVVSPVDWWTTHWKWRSPKEYPYAVIDAEASRKKIIIYLCDLGGDVFC